MDFINDNLFNKDLTIEKLTLFNFDEKKQFELDMLYRKVGFLFNTEKYGDFSYDLVFEHISFETCKKISDWLDKNSNIVELEGDGEVATKTLKFINFYLDYATLKNEIKKKS